MMEVYDTSVFYIIVGLFFFGIGVFLCELTRDSPFIERTWGERVKYGLFFCCFGICAILDMLDYIIQILYSIGQKHNMELYSSLASNLEGVVIYNEVIDIPWFKSGFVNGSMLWFMLFGVFLLVLILFFAITLYDNYSSNYGKESLLDKIVEFMIGCAVILFMTCSGVFLVLLALRMFGIVIV